jgi:hypothetical protein
LDFIRIKLSKLHAKDALPVTFVIPLKVFYL